MLVGPVGNAHVGCCYYTQLRKSRNAMLQEFAANIEYACFCLAHDSPWVSLSTPLDRVLSMKSPE